LPGTRFKETEIDDVAQTRCLAERDPELFFPIGNTGPAFRRIEKAKAVCRRFEVVDTCLKWAIECGQEAGVWGGLSDDERRTLNAERPAPAFSPGP
jgi:WhiB family redox-sensing transcriptional regulator